MKRFALWLLGWTYALLKRTPLIHLPLGKWIYYRVYAWCRPRELTEIAVLGHRLWLDPSDRGVASFLLTRGCYEPFQVSVVQRLLAPGDCFLDLGANLGYYTVIAAQAVGAQGRVVAFEPDPQNLQLLQRNVEVNSYRNRVMIQPCAIGAESGTCQLFQSVDNLGDHQILARGNDQRQAIDVPLRTLDQVIEPGTTVDLIKMDIQGAEFLAWAGMSRLLSSHPNLALLIEFWPEGIRRCGHEPAELVNAIYEQQFVAYLIDEQRERLLPISQQDLLRRCQATRQCNLVLARGTRAQQVADLTADRTLRGRIHER